MAYLEDEELQSFWILEHVFAACAAHSVAVSSRYHQGIFKGRPKNSLVLGSIYVDSL